MATRLAGAFGELAPDERERLGRFGAVLILVGSVISVPASGALEPAPAAHEYLLSATGTAGGLVALALPWRRISSAWLHLLMVFGTIEVALGVWIFSDDYAFFYVIVAMYAAYVVRQRAALVAYMSYFLIALLAPLAYDGGSFNEQIHHILVTLPVLLIVGVIVRYLRDTLERREREYRRFAEEAVQIAIRLRGEHLSHEPEDAIDRRLKDLAEAFRTPRSGR